MSTNKDPVIDHGNEILRKAAQEPKNPADRKYDIRTFITNDAGDTIPVAFISATTPKNIQVPAPLANTKYSHTFQDGVTKFSLMTSVAKCAYISYNWSETDFDIGKFNTIDEGGEYNIEGVELTGKTIYFKCDQAGITIEVEEWT